MIAEIDKNRLLIEHLPYGFAYHQMVLDDDGKPLDYIFLDVNPAFEEMTGLIKDQIVGRKVTEVLVDIQDSEFNWIEAFGKVATEEEVLDFEQYSEPLKRWYEVKAYSDEYGFFVTITQDITERKSIQEGLEKSEYEKHLILNSISESVAYLDTEFRIIWANQVAADSIGKPLEEIVGQVCYKLWSKRDEPCRGCPVLKVNTTKKPEAGEVTTDFGQVRYLQGYPTFNKYNEVIGLVQIGTDVTERKRMECDLQESENRFRQLVEMAPDAIFVRIDKYFAYVNQSAMRLFGVESEEELLGTSVMERFQPEYHDMINERMHLLNTTSQAAPRIEEVSLRLDGTLVDVEVEAIPIKYQTQDGALVYMRDISERKKLEKQKIKEQAILRHQQKLEAIGVLASGVAHEINNPINGIMNYAQLILDNVKVGDNAEYAGEIIRETERISTIVNNLLHFSRQEKQSHSLARIEDIIQHTLSLIRTLFRRDQIILELNVPEDLPRLKCRSQQIQQVLMNLLTNARDALNNKYKGYHDDKIIRIGCSMFHRDGRRWLRITVEDKGSGIPKSNYDKIFEPFFTTKPRDQGTGLGLSISYGIVKDHHGAITFKTKLGEYTLFRLDLPIDNGWDIDNDINNENE